MKYLLLSISVLMIASFASANEDSSSHVSEKEKSQYSQEYLSKVASERQNDLEQRLAIIREHEEYMKEISRGPHR